MSAAAIIVAAGRGTRMGAATPKAFLSVGGRSLFTYSLQTFAAVPGIDAIVLVVAEEYLDRAASEADRYRRPQIRIHLTPGGAERQDSVAAGIAALDDAPEVVLIHDAARPFVRGDTVRRCLDAARTGGAALVAIPARDTVKAVADGCVTATLDRATIWLAQTPQAFRGEVLRRALARARSEGHQATDDAALVERLGLPVRIVPGELSNTKVTTPDDLRWAEWYARNEWQAPGA